VKMVDECTRLGLTPLSPEEFAKEDKRMMTDLVRRRNGLDPAMQPVDFGTYGKFGDSPCIQPRGPKVFPLPKRYRPGLALRWRIFVGALRGLFRA